jgi:HipA-like protein
MKRLREAFALLRRSWGLSPSAPPKARPQQIEIVLAVPHGKRIVVGHLTSEQGEYVFRYSDVFKTQREIPPIAAFPDRDEEYRSVDLWPFFDVRLPPIDRPDVRRLLEQRQIDPADKFRLLVELAGRTVTSPYDLRLRSQGAAV